MATFVININSWASQIPASFINVNVTTWDDLQNTDIFSYSYDMTIFTHKTLLEHLSTNALIQFNIAYPGAYNIGDRVIIIGPTIIKDFQIGPEIWVDNN